MQTRNNWYFWLMPRTFDLVSTLLYLGTLGVYFYFRLAGICDECVYNLPLGGALLSLVVLLLLINDRLDYWLCGDKPLRKLAILFLAIRISLIILLSILDGFNFSLFVYLLIPYTAYAIFGLGVTLGLTALAWLLGIYKFFNVWSSGHTTIYDPEQVIYFIIYSVGLIFMLLMARVVEQEKINRQKAEKLLHELENSHQQLRDYASRVAALATMEERNRLARDIHDSLGHYLTAINVQLEKALAFRSKQPEIADQAVRDAKQMASEALADIRHSVGTLRNQATEFSLRHELSKLISNIAADHLKIDLQIDGDERDFAQPALMTLFRAAQEGLTNVQKHANADQIRITLTLHRQLGHLELCDNGVGFESSRATNASSQPSGYGLRGLQERLELVGGNMSISSATGQGTRLLVTVPAQSTHATGAS